MNKTKDLESRLSYEASFFDKRIEQSQFSENDLIIKPSPIDYKILNFLGIDVKQSPLKILDCGCGTGKLSVLLAKFGMIVSAIDISPRSIEITRKRAEINQVTNRVEARVMALENLQYNDNTFDIIVGDMVLHHVDIGKSICEIIRVLKPGGRAIFRETNAQNKILMMARSLLTGRFGIPKLRDEIENPISKKDMGTIMKITKGNCRFFYFSFQFFKMLDFYIFKGKSKVLQKILTTLDDLVYRYLSFLRKYSYIIIIEISK